MPRPRSTLNAARRRDALARERRVDPGLDAYVRSLEAYPILDPTREPAVARAARDGDLRARNQLVEGHLRLAVAVAREYAGQGVPLLDLIQEANIGLLAAAERFDPERGFRFSTYATWVVRGRAAQALADQASTIRVPRHVHRQRARVGRALERATADGREPTDEELRELAGVSAAHLERLRRAPWAPLSLDAELEFAAGVDHGEALTLADTLAAGDPTPEAAAVDDEARAALWRHLGRLTARERFVVTARYGLGEHEGPPWTLERVGRALGLTRERARQIEAEALATLRAAYAAGPSGGDRHNG